jgi:hypothetical protein
MLHRASYYEGIDVSKQPIPPPSVSMIKAREKTRLHKFKMREKKMGLRGGQR